MPQTLDTYFKISILGADYQLYDTAAPDQTLTNVRLQRLEAGCRVTGLIPHFP